MNNSIPSGKSGADVGRAAHALAGQGLWRHALGLLCYANQCEPSAALQQQIIDLRIRAGRDQPQSASNNTRVKGLVAAAGHRGADSVIPELTPAELSAQRLYDGIHRQGAVIVRGLLDQQTVASLRTSIDRTVSAHQQSDGMPVIEPDAAWYVRSPEVEGEPSRFFNGSHISPATESSTIWTADSPRMACDLLELYEELGLPALLREYFGEPAMLSVKKWVLRKLAPNNGEEAGWHQDGRFLGENIRTVNMWIALSECGDGYPAPGIDLVVGGKREIYPTGTDGAWFDWTVGPGVVAQIAEDASIVRPRFESGDALFFDHYNLHRSAFGDDHNKVRYAIESWFFATSSAPAKQHPIVL